MYKIRHTEENKVLKIGLFTIKDQKFLQIIKKNISTFIKTDVKR
jgi:hypothetical protein